MQHRRLFLGAWEGEPGSATLLSGCVTGRGFSRRGAEQPERKLSPPLRPGVASALPGLSPERLGCQPEVLLRSLALCMEVERDFVRRSPLGSGRLGQSAASCAGHTLARGFKFRSKWARAMHIPDESKPCCVSLLPARVSGNRFSMVHCL